MMAEARSDELQAQVRLFEEQGLRLRLHPGAHAEALPPELSPPRLAGPARVSLELFSPGEAPPSLF